ncbi:MAG: tetratricopeptide repeat protein [Synechococcaceae bacterium WB8_1B_136]|nr:tetratricopeptide repeat protein [Synechococcaceae bacterium WB8_1B_136]
MPPRLSATPRPGPLLALGAVVLMGLSLAGGWWLGQRSGGSGQARSRDALERQATVLQERMAQGSASQADRQRLLEVLLALGDTKEATALLEQLADQHPDQWQLRLLLAEVRRHGNDRAGAERELRQLLNLKPDRIEALQLMTLLQLEQGRGKEAEAQLRALMEKTGKPTPQPQQLPIGLLLADLLQRQQRPAEATALYGKLAGDFPSDPRPLLALAVLQQQQGDTKAAQETLALARRRQGEKGDPRLDQVAASWGLAGLKGPSPAAPKPNQASRAVPEPGPPAP